MLATAQNVRRLWCEHCSRITKHETGFFDDTMALGCALGFFTCGIGWLIIPVGLILGRNYVCCMCGTKRTKQFWSSK